jgi:hypothetical protein
VQQLLVLACTAVAAGETAGLQWQPANVELMLLQLCGALTSSLMMEPAML